MANMPNDIVQEYIEAFEDTREVYTSCCGTSLDPYHRKRTENFKKSWQILSEEPCVNLSVTPKMHQVGDHFSEYFEDHLVKTGQGLGVTTDQTI